ncbi:MAG: thermonuclease family protein [Nitrospira sp.]|nr:thermonuclease family protein [Nitrospira sp.]
MIFRTLLFVLFPILLFTPSVDAAFPFTGKVVAVLDGDTIDVLHNGKAERIRLRGVDCPEKKQPFGQKAKQFTSSLVFGKIVTVVPSEKGRYGRTIGEVFLPNGANLSYELVRAGLAWWYQQYSDDVVLGALELDAQVARRGLWIDPRPIPPWEYRHPKKNKRTNKDASRPLVGVE